MADSTRVDPDALLAFGHRLMSVLDGTDLSAGYSPTTGQTQLSIRGVSLGLSGMREAAYAGSSYAAAADAAGQFLADTYDGLLALAYVAGTVAETYRAGDAEQADQMAQVTAALTPPPGRPSLASAEADQEAAAAAAHQAENEQTRFLNQVGAPHRPDQEEARFLNQVSAAHHPTAPRATGGSTVDNGRWDPQEPLNNRPGRYADQVRTHDDVMTAGGAARSAEDDVDLQGEYQEAAAKAEQLSETDRIPYVVVVDEHGHSEVEQQFEDDVPYRPTVDYAEPVATTNPSPAVTSYGD